MLKRWHVFALIRVNYGNNTHHHLFVGGPSFLTEKEAIAHVEYSVKMKPHTSFTVMAVYN